MAPYILNEYVDWDVWHDSSTLLGMLERYHSARLILVSLPNYMKLLSSLVKDSQLHYATPNSNHLGFHYWGLKVVPIALDDDHAYVYSSDLPQGIRVTIKG